jgi:hypothetical protein
MAFVVRTALLRVNPEPVAPVHPRPITSALSPVAPMIRGMRHRASEVPE